MTLRRYEKIYLVPAFCIFLAACGTQNTPSANVKPRIHEIPADKIVYEVSGIPEWDEFYNTTYDQAAASDLVILGEVEDYTCAATGVLISTNVSVRVDEVLKGNVSNGEVIQISEMGGTVTVKEYLEALQKSGQNEEEAKELAEAYTEQEQQENYVQFSSNDLIPMIGQKSVYFLKRDEENQNYYRINEAYGQLVEVDTGEYMCAHEVADSKIENGEPAYLTLEEGVDTENEDLSLLPIWNMDEIKQDMETKPEQPTEYPQAPEDLENSDTAEQIETYTVEEE